MLRIHCRTIAHSSHRYPTVGDYWTTLSGTQEYRVSDMNNWRYEFLVLLHELIESHLCQDRGISEESITAFDLKFEKEREEGKHTDDEEPGCDRRAPYYKEHMFAMKVEKMMARMLKVKWSVYDKTVMSL